MFWLQTKKEARKEFKKISKAFKDRDLKISKQEQDITQLKAEINKLNNIITREEIEQIIRKIMKEQRPELNSTELNQPNQTQFERVMIQKAIKSRPEALKQTIRGCLIRGMRTTDIFKLIVEEKRLINKTQFYHYLKLVRAELRPELHTELHTEH